jgi:hypothetical protein
MLRSDNAMALDFLCLKHDIPRQQLPILSGIFEKAAYD